MYCVIIKGDLYLPGIIFRVTGFLLLKKEHGMDAKNKRNFILLGACPVRKDYARRKYTFILPKAINRKGRIEDGSTVGDYSFDEIGKKNNSINLSLLFCDL